VDEGGPAAGDAGDKEWFPNVFFPVGPKEDLIDEKAEPVPCLQEEKEGVKEEEKEQSPSSQRGHGASFPAERLQEPLQVEAATQEESTSHR